MCNDFHMRRFTMSLFQYLLHKKLFISATMVDMTDVIEISYEQKECSRYATFKCEGSQYEELFGGCRRNNC